REILGATIERYLENPVLLVLGAVDVDLSFAIEEIRHRVWRAEVAAESGELVPNFGHRSRRIVAQRRDQNRHPTRTVAFVSDFGVVHALEIARSFLDGALDVLLGHRLLLRRVDRR